MVRAIGYDILFAAVGLITFALIAPLVFHGADMRGIGAVFFPIIVLVCGGIGFAIGVRRGPKP